MILALTLSAVVITVTLLIQAMTIALASNVLRRLETWLLTPNYSFKMITVLVGITLWLMVGISLSVWIWAMVYRVLGVFGTWEAALYFATVSFTTLGYGDLVIGNNWRLLSALSAANGLIIFSLTTAYLLEVLRRLRTAQGAARLNATGLRIPE